MTNLHSLATAITHDDCWPKICNILHDCWFVAFSPQRKNKKYDWIERLNPKKLHSQQYHQQHGRQNDSQTRPLCRFDVE